MALSAARVAGGSPQPGLGGRHHSPADTQGFPVSGRDQDRVDLTTVLGNAVAGGDGHLRITERVQKSATQKLSTWVEKRCRFRTKAGLNEHLERHKNVTGSAGVGQWIEFYNFASLRPSFYVVEGNRFC